MPVKRPIFRYALLALLFAITVAYEVPYLHDILWDKTSVPFFTMQLASNKVAIASKEAAQAGVHKGDEVLSIKGRAYRGLSDWAEAFDHTPAGQNIAMVVRSNPSSLERTVVLPVRAKRADSWQIIGDVTLYFLLPGVCIVLGFWVAVQRPRDPMAWLLLALMLAFPHIFESYKAQAWPPGWREAAVFYHVSLGGILPAVMFLFGRFFPEPFPAVGRLDTIWKIQQWVLAAPFAVFAILGAIESAIDLSSYRSAIPLEHATHPFDRVLQVFGYLLIGSFFAAMGTKYGVSRSPDAGRRLRILYWGATLAWTPALIVLVLYPRFFGKTAAEVLPQWAIVMALVPLILFPLTLAYVIVVQKAMGVGVALRQGLQYGLARGGVRLLQRGAVAAAIVAAVAMASNPGRNRPQKIAVIAIAVTAVFSVVAGESGCAPGLTGVSFGKLTTPNRS